MQRHKSQRILMWQWLPVVKSHVGFHAKFGLKNKWSNQVNKHFKWVSACFFLWASKQKYRSWCCQIENIEQSLEWMQKTHSKRRIVNNIVDIKLLYSLFITLLEIIHANFFCMLICWPWIQVFIPNYFQFEKWTQKYYRHRLWFGHHFDRDKHSKLSLQID